MRTEEGLKVNANCVVELKVTDDGSSRERTGRQECRVTQDGQRGRRTIEVHVMV